MAQQAEEKNTTTAVHKPMPRGPLPPPMSLPYFAYSAAKSDSKNMQTPNSRVQGRTNLYTLNNSKSLGFPCYGQLETSDTAYLTIHLFYDVYSQIYGRPGPNSSGFDVEIILQ